MSRLLTDETTAIKRINRVIDSYFKQAIEQSDRVSPHYSQLWRDVRRLVGSGGKRLRPKMVLIAYRTFGGDSEQSVLSVAAAQELLHISLLIHDDIIDRDYIRYGVDNIAGRYNKTFYSNVIDVDDRLHYAQSAALLAGDLLISASYQLMLDATISSESLRAIQAIHGQSIFEVAGGELIDTESGVRPFGDIDAITIATYKTASYTFVGPLLIGATLAGASEEDKTHVKEFAQNLGIAYQLRDDVIGITGDEKQTGKTTIGDIREGKHTYVIEQFVATAAEDERAYFDLYFGDKHIQKDEVDAIKKLLVSSGALVRTEKAIEDYANRSRVALSKLTVNSDTIRGLEELIDIVTKRDK